jgi:hypothetical protein
MTGPPAAAPTIVVRGMRTGADLVAGVPLIEGHFEFSYGEGRAIITRRCGPSFSTRSFSSGGVPSRKLPAGTANVSGQTGQSRNAPDRSR